ncbi:MAG TPA: hypothetical protein VHW65_04165 [Gemmatimonadales bacterium]|jgi:hypothetical protein|nr:hypothetical protein [Gemmatimonadales bacterium]
MRRTALLASVLAIGVIPRCAQAQAAYEIEVYGAEMAVPGSLLLELHSNYTITGSQGAAGGRPGAIDDDDWQRPAHAADPACTSGGFPLFSRVPATNASFHLTPGDAISAAATPCNAATTNTHAIHETLEASTGLTSWAELGAYVFASKMPDGGLQVVGGSARLRVRAPLEWKLPVDAGLSVEVEHEGASYSPNTLTLEIRPIFDRSAGRWYVSLNPTIERTLRGAGVTAGLGFSPSGKLSCDLNRVVSAGVEYYGAFGQLGSFAPPLERLQQFFGVVDLHTGAAWEINGGLGVGTTPASSHLVAKVILGRRLTF